jgi:hypothetical protein
MDGCGYTTLNHTVYWTQYRHERDAVTSRNASSKFARWP